MIAFTGLCATAPGASEATLPVLLPLTALANRLGAPILSGDVINVLMYGGMTLCALGLAGMLWANSLGWNPDPRRVFWTAVVVVAVVVCITPVGTSDPASYASYGRIAALGHNPYIFTPGRPARRRPQSVHRAGRPAMADDSFGVRPGGHLDAAGRRARRRRQAVADHLGPDDHDRDRASWPPGTCCCARRPTRCAPA